ncbi:AmmeMemoRadiSam system protein A [Catenovulum sediminis]|uniref:AmmeMemoRadiSam system protein A n=1 Tax=Catenovulum sediminis TaxID=1740262 RepID=A0ABV1RLP0_9ALTE|nr:AmmeMemoRadiSam system protein A [Catenovulum sediminis]
MLTVSSIEQPDVTKHVIEIVRNSLSYAFHNQGDRLPEHLIPTHPALADSLACFVSLSDHGGLRGCVGTTVPNGRLDNNISWYAHEAAFHDPRFDPIRSEEFAKLNTTVSVMSKPLQMVANSEAELIEQLIPGRDGLMIQYGQLNGVFLPCMWREFSEPTAFLHALKEKAGWPPHGWTAAMRALVFQTYRIEGALAN